MCVWSNQWLFFSVSVVEQFVTSMQENRNLSNFYANQLGNELMQCSMQTSIAVTFQCSLPVSLSNFHLTGIKQWAYIKMMWKLASSNLIASGFIPQQHCFYKYCFYKYCFIRMNNALLMLQIITNNLMSLNRFLNNCLFIFQ